MNTEQPTGSSLPELSARRIDEIEDALFADIAADRRRRRARRGRMWLAGGAAAGVVAIAAIIAPSLGGVVGGGGGFSSADGAAIEPGATVAEDAPAPVVGGDEKFALDQTVADETAAGRAIITTASASVLVDDPAAAARAVGADAEARGGYVESLSVGSSGQVLPMTSSGDVAYDVLPYPSSPDGAWITVRVPTDELSDMVVKLSDLGELTSSSINRQDVTDQTIDLQARIDAAQASVDRLTQLMAQAGSLTDLIAAEFALSERQAVLESYQQQLESLEGMVEMSSLSVSLTPEVETVTADPAGFGDGVVAGWNGLVAALNGIVIGIGFLLPWIAVVAVVGLIVWGIVRLVRRGRRGTGERQTDAAAPRRDDADTTPDEVR